jgi:hypothetical protein
MDISLSPRLDLIVTAASVAIIWLYQQFKNRKGGTNADQLIDVMANMNKRIEALEKELADCLQDLEERVADRVIEKQNGHSKRPKSSRSLSSRNAKILKALKTKSVSAVAEEFELSTTTIYRIRKAA